MSIRPKRLATSSNAAPTCLALDTSHAIATASPPAFLMVPTVSCPASAERSRTAISAPSCAIFIASPAPMPLPAPVTTATRPSSLPISDHLSLQICRDLYYKLRRLGPRSCDARNCIQNELICSTQITYSVRCERGRTQDGGLVGARGSGIVGVDGPQNGGLLPAAREEA